jgi:hypothetical protein
MTRVAPVGEGSSKNTTIASRVPVPREKNARVMVEDPSLFWKSEVEACGRSER